VKEGKGGKFSVGDAQAWLAVPPASCDCGGFRFEKRVHNCLWKKSGMYCLGFVSNRYRQDSSDREPRTARVVVKTMQTECSGLTFSSGLPYNQVDSPKRCVLVAGIVRRGGFSWSSITGGMGTMQQNHTHLMRLPHTYGLGGGRGCQRKHAIPSPSQVFQMLESRKRLPLYIATKTLLPSDPQVRKTRSSRNRQQRTFHICGRFWGGRRCACGCMDPVSSNLSLFYGSLGQSK